MTARRRAALACSALGLELLSACAPTAVAGNSAQNAAAIMGGQTDTTHTAVVAIVLQTGGGIALCSGSLIAPNLVLTARHCVSQLSSRDLVCQAYTDSTGAHAVTTAAAPYAPTSFAVTTDQAPSETSAFVGVAEVLVPVGTTGVSVCGKDIALLRLATPITDAGLIVPRLDLPGAVGETFTAAGYGATDGAGDGSGQRRYRDGLTVQFVGQAFARSGTTNVEVTTAQELIADTGTCEGDSGSPALDALGQSFGILSRGGANTCDQPIYTQVSAYAMWIRDEATAAASAAGEPVQPWVTPPVSGSANQGDDCVSDDQCVAPLVCLILGDRRRCTTTDCTSCATGWICGTANGAPACVPDPSVMPPTDPDAGTPPADGDADATSGADASTAGARHSGCGVGTGGATGHGGAVALLAGLALAVGARRRRGAR